MTDFLNVITTTSTRKEAKLIANKLINKKLAACVQIIGAIESTYMWKNKKEISKELLVFIKTKRNLYHKVEKEIKNLHSYENPEIIAIPIIKGNKNYLNWVLNETSE